MSPTAQLLQEFAPALEKAGFCTKSEKAILNVWHPDAPRIGVSVLLHQTSPPSPPTFQISGLCALGPSDDMPRAVQALTRVFVSWSLPIPAGVLP